MAEKRLSKGCDVLLRDSGGYPPKMIVCGFEESVGGGLSEFGSKRLEGVLEASVCFESVPPGARPAAENIDF